MKSAHSLALLAVGLLSLPIYANAQEQADRYVSVLAVEFKMTRSVEETPYPNTLEQYPELAEEGGYVIHPPNEAGEWGADVYHWDPGTIVVNQGENVLLEFFGVNGDEHPTTIEGYDQEFTVLRGQLTRVQFVADTPGIFQIVCHAHPPTMVAELVVLPAP